MAQVEKLSKNITQAEAIKRVAEIVALVDEYGYGDRKVYPYSTPEKVSDVVNGYKDWVSDLDDCTRDSRQYVIYHINGFVDILNKWISHSDARAKEPKYRVLVRYGETASRQELTKSQIELFLNVEGVTVEEVEQV